MSNYLFMCNKYELWFRTPGTRHFDTHINIIDNHIVDTDKSYMGMKLCMCSILHSYRKIGPMKFRQVEL